MAMRFTKPRGVLSGFWAIDPNPEVPELIHAGEQWVPADFQIIEHSHAGWELYLQLDGGDPGGPSRGPAARAARSSEHAKCAPELRPRA